MLFLVRLRTPGVSFRMSWTASDASIDKTDPDLVEVLGEQTEIGDLSRLAPPWYLIDGSVLDDVFDSGFTGLHLAATTEVRLQAESTATASRPRAVPLRLVRAIGKVDLSIDGDPRLGESRTFRCENWNGMDFCSSSMGLVASSRSRDLLLTSNLRRAEFLPVVQPSDQ
jgi:hypothetical protein